MDSESSDESQDELDVPVDVDQDPEEDNLEEDPENNSQGDDDQETRPVPSAPYSEPGEDYALPSVRPEALSASVYDIIPTMYGIYLLLIFPPTPSLDIRPLHSPRYVSYI